MGKHKQKKLPVETIETVKPDKLIESATVTRPAISVIIPMYNAEDYISECLDSLLAQTFRDFEVIIANDCSTDNSVAIIESYMPKFNGRLKLTKTETNSGGCAIPRNVGLPLAQGEYIYFMDSDDTFTKTALEEVYTLAKEYDADVVYCERYYMSEGVGEDFIKNIHIATDKMQKPPYVDEPTLDSEDIADRVQGILNGRYWFAAWLKLVRHELLDKHNLVFPYIKPGEDNIWTFGLLFFAKKFLRVPNMIYIRRMREGSIMSKERTPQQTMSFWLNPILLGLKELDKLMAQIEFFKENPQLRYAILESHFQGKLKVSFSKVGQLTPADVYKAIKEDFGDKLGEYDVLISALCTHIFDQGEAFKQAQQKLKSVEYLEKRIATKDAEIKQLKDSATSKAELRQASPDVTVIISMYNSEKYIGELLDSILAQTFQNFEVIVVDDCSIDNSVEVVKSYVPKFNGRLRQAKTVQNTGNPSVARNMGVDLSRGEYLFVLDSDDTITPDAIEKLYKVAKEFDADVVTCEKFYPVPEDLWYDAEYRRQLKPWSYQKPPFVDKPTLVPFDLAKRAQDCYDTRFVWELWDKMVRRDCLIDNQIRSQNIMGQDFLVVYCLMYTAKRIVRVPYLINYYRKRKDSLYNSHNDYCEPIDKLKAYLTQLNVGLKYIDDLLSKREYFQENPQVKRLALNVYLKRIWNVRFGGIYNKISAQELREALREEFGETALLIELFFENLFEAGKEKAAPPIPPNVVPFITARIDIVLKSTRDFEKFSVIDKVAKVAKPKWLQSNGFGYMINSYSGKLEIFAKAAEDGQVVLNLRSLNICAPEDKSKHVPYWIDYTKLVINEKNIFNTIISAWHDEPYTYSLETKAGEEFKIQLEWQPHISDIIAPESKAKTPPSKPESKVMITPTIESHIPNKLNPFTTARIDAKFVNKTNAGDFQILSISDENANVAKPSWFQRTGIGYVIHSSIGELTFVAKATVDGQVQFNLRGLEVRNRGDWANGVTKRIPYWVDYTSFTINGRTIFNNRTPAWCDEPYYHNIEVKANEKITVKVEWKLHRNVI
ncbi:MAG: glycosyltransferase [Quinella sp. 1Q5]|nr:glycosyltransferase [Quinella sp. 1Q5]